MRKILTVSLCLLCVFILASQVFAAGYQDYDPEGTEVYIATYEPPIFRIHYGIHHTAPERANILQRRVNALLNTINHTLIEGREIDPETFLEGLVVVREAGQVNIVFGDQLIVTVDRYEAARNDATREALAGVWRDNLIQALEHHIESHTVPEQE